GEEVAVTHLERRDQADHDEAQVEEQPQVADQGDLDGGDGQGEGGRERGDLTATRVAVPQHRHPLSVAGHRRVTEARSDVAHGATVCSPAASSPAARRGSGCTEPRVRTELSLGAGPSRVSWVASRSSNRRAATSTRDSHDPTAWL